MKIEIQSGPAPKLVGNYRAGFTKYPELMEACNKLKVGEWFYCDDEKFGKALYQMRRRGAVPPSVSLLKCADGRSIILRGEKSTFRPKAAKPPAAPPPPAPPTQPQRFMTVADRKPPAVLPNGRLPVEEIKRRAAMAANPLPPL